MGVVGITSEEEFIEVLESGRVVCIDIKVDIGYTAMDFTLRVSIRKVNDFYSVYTDNNSYCTYDLRPMLKYIMCYDVWCEEE